MKSDKEFQDFNLVSYKGEEYWLDLLLWHFSDRDFPDVPDGINKKPRHVVDASRLGLMFTITDKEEIKINQLGNIFYRDPQIIDNEATTEIIKQIKEHLDFLIKDINNNEWDKWIGDLNF